MTLGRQLRRPDLPATGAHWCEAALPQGSVYRFLARERARLFPPELFADLFEATGRRSVPPSILAVVMVLQRLEGLSDREAADRYAFDVRWRYAAGVADAVVGEETASFAHTVLVDLRARLRRSQDPDRIFRVTCQLARQVGLVGVRRVLDSAPLEDAVTTQDTVTMLRGAIRGLLRACPPELKAKVRAGLQREDDYTAPGKPACDWTDRAAREELVDALVRDAYRAHYALRDQRLDERTAEAAVLLATVTGQDIEETSDGRFRIFEGTAPDRVISTVDPEARHGHKTAAHGFDGYKAHVAVDPDSEVICAAEVSPATSGDASVAPTLLDDLAPGKEEPAAQAVVYGDAAYGTGAHLAWLEEHELTPMVTTQLPTAPGGRFTKDQFRIDLQAGTVTCPARVTVAIRPARRGGGRARFGPACSVCPLRSACTSSVRGRVVAIHPQEADLAAARTRQRDPAWLADYRATRPKVERKLAHLLRRRHGGRHARVRGLVRVGQDFKLLAAAVNLARFATLGLCSTPDGWQVQPA
ncbi:MAG: IS1182 family transposase [Actinomycetota bacterium]|nr:IS1182 family transposase [Actinomycetota bacterium]